MNLSDKDAPRFPSREELVADLKAMRFQRNCAAWAAIAMLLWALFNLALFTRLLSVVTGEGQ